MVVEDRPGSHTSLHDDQDVTPLPVEVALPDLAKPSTSGKGKGIGKKSTSKKSKTKTSPKGSEIDILQQIAKSMQSIQERRSTVPTAPIPLNPDEAQIKSFADLISSSFRRMPRHLWTHAMTDCMLTLARYENMDPAASGTMQRSAFRPPPSPGFPSTVPAMQQQQLHQYHPQPHPQPQLGYAGVFTPTPSNPFQARGQQQAQQASGTSAPPSTPTRFGTATPTYTPLVTPPEQQQHGQGELNTPPTTTSTTDVISFNEDMYL